MDLYLASDNTITLNRVRDGTTGAYLNSGSGTWYLLTKAGTQVTSGTGSLTYVTSSDGKYTGVIDYLVVTPPNVTDQTDYDVKCVFVQGNYNATVYIPANTKYKT